MATQKSCGFLILRGEPVREFLLMRHKDRWDLPKGHVDPGESELQCALRELREETGLAAADIEPIEGFRFTLEYPVRNKRTGQLDDKTLVVFLARLAREVEINPSEHPGYQWFPWQPPHRIQQQTIDPLLEAVRQFMVPGH
ncbi:MAG TPA: NUDIX domain-containing protein [Pirellulaceae bacterium]|nr:NUDIX domain-containing protein [Pirellulaceae bacterium]